MVERFHSAYAVHREDACQLGLPCVPCKTARLPRPGNMRFCWFVEGRGVPVAAGDGWVRDPGSFSRRCRANPRPPMAVVALGGWGQCSRTPVSADVRSLLLISVAGRDVDGWDSRPGDEVAYPFGGLAVPELSDYPGAGEFIGVCVVPDLTDN